MSAQGCKLISKKCAFFCFPLIYRTENSSTIPDVALSKPIPKNSSHQFKLPSLSKASHQQSTSLSFFNALLTLNKPATNSASALASHTHCNDSDAPAQHESDSTAILMPSSSMFGRNGIKSNLNQLARMKFGDNVSVNNTGDSSTNEYCNTSNSGTGKLLNSLS